MSAGGATPAQPRGLRRLRRAVWTLRCFLEYRRRLNGDLLCGFAYEAWPWATIWQLAEASAANQADSNDHQGFAWDSPAEAVQGELECWSE